MRPTPDRFSFPPTSISSTNVRKFSKGCSSQTYCRLQPSSLRLPFTPIYRPNLAFRTILPWPRSTHRYQTRTPLGHHWSSVKAVSYFCSLLIASIITLWMLPRCQHRSFILRDVRAYHYYLTRVRFQNALDRHTHPILTTIIPRWR